MACQNEEFISLDVGLAQEGNVLWKLKGTLLEKTEPLKSTYSSDHMWRMIPMR